MDGNRALQYIALLMAGGLAGAHLFIGASQQVHLPAWFPIIYIGLFSVAVGADPGEFIRVLKIIFLRRDNGSGPSNGR